MVTVSDKKIGVDVSGASTDAEYYLADVVSSGDNFAFGAEMDGRTFNPTFSEFGFNGKRKDNEMYGEGNAMDFGARISDTRLGRWMSRDPKEGTLPGISTYHFGYNNPILFDDPNGESGRLSVVKNSNGGGTITLETIVHLYGKDAKAGVAAALNQAYKSLGPATRTVKDKEGCEWTVTIKVTYTDINAKVIDQALEGTDYRVPQTTDLNTTDGIVGYQEGDYILKLDNTSEDGGTSGIGLTGGVVGKGGTGKTAVHEPFHGLGFADLPDAVQLSDDKNDLMPMEYYDKRKDAMNTGHGTFDVKNIHYTDLVDFVDKLTKETENMNKKVITKVISTQISKNRTTLTDKTVKKSNQRVHPKF